MNPLPLPHKYVSVGYPIYAKAALALKSTS